MAEKAQAAPQGRRYVGTAETVGFIMYEGAREVSIRPDGEWVDRILAIRKGTQALWGLPMAAWDIINDVFLAALVEKTRTRFGKFRPYLILYPLYGLPMNLLLLALPYIFWDTGDTYLPKVLAYVAMSMFNELTGTIGEMARVGMMANITPDPQERLSLITKSKFLAFGSSLPKQIFEVTRDIVSRNTKVSALQVNMNMRRMFTVFGLITMTLSCGLSLYFAVVSKERVVASDAAKEKPPTIRESLKALTNNRPLFMVMLSEILGGVTVRSQYGVYVNSILNFTNFGNVFGLPGGIVSTLSYTYVNKLRARYSSKTLWIASQNLHKPIIIAIYFFGMIRTKTPGKGNGIYRMYAHLWPMIGAYCIDDLVYMALYGTKQVIPEEIRNECIDYGEWKSGFRSEAMVGALRGIPSKIAGQIGNFLTNMVMEIIGFQVGEGYLKQTEKTADGIFVMSTIIPTLFGMIAVIPQFFYNISQKDRELMYAELAERREAAREAIIAMHQEEA